MKASLLKIKIQNQPTKQTKKKQVLSHTDTKTVGRITEVRTVRGQPCVEIPQNNNGISLLQMVVIISYNRMLLETAMLE